MKKIYCPGDLRVLEIFINRKYFWTFKIFIVLIYTCQDLTSQNLVQYFKLPLQYTLFE